VNDDQTGVPSPDADADAAARVLKFTQVAQHADLPHILAALSDAEITAGVEHLGTRLPLPVADHIVAQGPSAARLALARQLGDIQQDSDLLVQETRRKLLRLADPDVNGVQRPDRWRILVRHLMEVGELDYNQLAARLSVAPGIMAADSIRPRRGS
jgi:hypothetical protein